MKRAAIARLADWAGISGQQIERSLGRGDHPGSGRPRSYSHRDVEAARYWSRSQSFASGGTVEQARRRDGRDLARHSAPGWIVHTAEGVHWSEPTSLPLDGTGWAIPVHVDCGHA